MTTEPTQSGRSHTEPLIGRGWVQGVALVMIFGFLVLGILVYRTYTAEYLRMATDDVADQWHAQGASDPRDRVVVEFRTNRYIPEIKTLVFSDRQVRAFDDIQRYYANYFGENSTKYGLLPHTRTNGPVVHQRLRPMMGGSRDRRSRCLPQR